MLILISHIATSSSVLLITLSSLGRPPHSSLASSLTESVSISIFSEMIITFTPSWIPSKDVTFIFIQCLQPNDPRFTITKTSLLTVFFFQGRTVALLLSITPVSPCITTLLNNEICLFDINSSAIPIMFAAIEATLSLNSKKKRR